MSFKSVDFTSGFPSNRLFESNVWKLISQWRGWGSATESCNNKVKADNKLSKFPKLTWICLCGVAMGTFVTFKIYNANSSHKKTKPNRFCCLIEFRDHILTSLCRYRFFPNRRGGVSGFGVPPARRQAPQENAGGLGGRHNWGQGFRLGGEWERTALSQLPEELGSCSQI